MPTSTRHSAAGPAAGFEQQRRLALVLLAEAYLREPSVKVSMETLEDIELSGPESSSGLIEVKHHLKDHRLTDFSPELWRTLEIWIEAIREAAPEDWPSFFLMTTAIAAPDSAASLLGETGRDQVGAMSRLLEVAAISTDKETASARAGFLGLDHHLQLALLERVKVLDGTPRVGDLQARLARALALALPRTQPETFLEGVEGWWVGRSGELLTGAIDHVRGEDLEAFCRAHRDRFDARSLVTHRELRKDPSEEEKEPYRDRRFVRQLEVVEAGPGQIDLAIRYYLRAHAQRGRWARELDDLASDFEDFEDRLQDEWEPEHLGMCDRVGEDERERCSEGRRLAFELGGRSTARLRNVDEPVLRHGTLHRLADRLRVGWHPEFRKLMAGQADESAEELSS